MKKLLTLVLLVSGFAAQSQIHVGSNMAARANSAGRLSPGQLENLKKTTTVFTLQFKDMARRAEFEQAIKSVWTITPFKVIGIDELKQYLRGGYSIFSFGGYTDIHQGRTTTPMFSHFTYDLWIPDHKKNGKIRQDFYSRIFLFADSKLLREDRNNVDQRQKDYSRHMIDFIYNKAEFFNWEPGLLKGYLQEVNAHLLSGSEQGPYTEVVRKKELAKLQHDTLYVPDYVLIHYNPRTGEESKKKQSVKEWQQEYGFPMKIVSAATISDMVLAGRSFYYLSYVKSGTDKYVSVYHSKTGKMLYTEYTPISYNFKEKDLHRIAQKVD